MPANMKSAHIVVIDQSIDGYLSLLEAATAGGHEVILLSGKGDGFLELGQAIAGRSDIQSIHLFSHGSEGAIQLGQAQLNINNLNEYADVLETIKSSLVEGGDLLIYGCNVAGSEEGKQFVAALSEVLNADMAASDDLTGHRDLGGDWELEYQHGDISPVGDWLWSVRSEFMQTLGSTVALNSSWLTDNTDDWIYSDNQNGGDLSGTPDSIYINIESQNPQLTYPVEFTIESISNTPFNLDSIAVRPFATSNPYYLEILPDGDEGRKVTVPTIENQPNETVIISVELNSITSFTVRFLDQGVQLGPPINLDFLNFSTSDAPVNNDPLFIDYGPFSIAENSVNGSVVGDINANDGDGGADDANVTYSIVSGNPNLDLDGNSAFSIDINTGVITVNDTDDIDFEIATSHTLTISATDQNSAMTTQSVTINVTDDEGDNPPMLNTGDMAVLGWNALNDTITFTTLVDLPAGTVIKFTDKGWDQSTNAFTTSSTGDGVITWTVGSPINAGSVFELFMGGSDEVTTLINKTANVDLTADIVSSSFTVTDPMNLAGDSVFIYQGDDSNPFFIFGMNNSGGTVDSTNWNTSIVATLRDSMLPNSTGSQNTLTNGANAIGLPGGASQLDNVQYTGPTSIADKATWLARIADVGNWAGDNTGTVSTSAGINVQIGVANEAPVFTTSNKASVAENTTAVTTLVATDADGDVLTYSLTGGADQALFTLDTKSGALSFKSAPDFEAPADSNGDNTYTVEVTASDGQGGNTPLTLTVTVTDVNEAPTLTGATKVSVAENATGTFYIATASDPENDALTYMLSGTDAALFTLDANSGALSFKSAPDFEAPADAGGNNVYDVILTASDGSLSSAPQTLAITVTDVDDGNEAPVFTTSSKASVPENTTVVTTLVATDADGDMLTYSLTGGADQALFTLDTKSGALSFKSAPDFEAPADSNGDNTYTVEVTASDGHGGNTPLTLTVTVTDVNEAPTLTGATKVSVAENTTGTFYTALASDPEDDALTYTLSGTDAALFTMDANSGALSFKSAPDFEAPADAGGNNIYDVILTANDGSLSSSPQALAITVTNVNEVPVFVTSSKASVTENITAVTTLVATDVDGDTLTYSITGGADQALFNLDTKSGALTFISAPDYEAPADSNGDNAYNVEVTANDGQGGTTPLTLTVTVTDVNEAPTLVGASKVDVAENTTGTIYTALASDPENDTLFYTLSGTDAALFNLDANSGALSFKNAPDFEAPADAGGNNIYDVILTANDGSLNSVPQALSITVTDVVDGNNAPVFTTSSKASVAENTTAVTTLLATDADGDTLTYSIIGGADQALFSLDSKSGTLTFIGAPDYEAPIDSNNDNDYNVTVAANDGHGGSTPLSLTVTVTDVNEAPILNGSTKESVTVSENATGTVFTATGSDPENDPLIYTLSGTDAALFNLDANSGALSFKNAPDFEAPADAGGNNVYDVILTASDGSLSSAPQALAITVTDIDDGNEAPVFTTSSKASVAENTTAVTTLVATDADGDVLTYSLTGGADQALFTLDTKSGALSFKSAPNFEAPADSNSDNTYTVEVTASDGQGGSAPLTLEVTVTDVNEAPTLVGATKVSVAENSTGTLYSALGSDPENDALTYKLSGADAALFTLDANSGALSFKSAPDFEAPADAGGNNVYDVILTASDGSLSSAPQTLAITVTDVNEAPVFTTANKVSVAENTTAVTTLVATDADGDMLTYSLTGGADQALFTLDANSGGLSFKSAPDFEAPADSNSDNTYTVEVTASDGQGGNTPLTLEVTVTDVNETSPTTPPIIPPEEPQPPTVPVPGSIAVTPGGSQPNTPSGNISISEIITNNGTSPGSVRLVENTGNANIVTATLPGRVSLQHDGSRTATDQDSAMADLIASIVGKSPANMPDQTNVASQWLSSLAEDSLLDIRTLTFSAIEPIATPIFLTGSASNNSLSSHLEAFVIDTSALPVGTLLQLDNIEFASIVGNAVITGGSGNNIVIGDDAAQHIVLGEGDDVLYGGGGDDVIGSEGGDDRLFGGNGNDELFGGAGTDMLHGGRDVDVASYQGNRDEYVVTQLHSVITVSRKDDPSDVDTLINIETLRFTDDEENISYANDLGWITGLYGQVLGRQGDVEGVQYWAQRHDEGMSKADMALLFINSVEAGEQLTTQDQSMEAILDILYQSLLDREADAEGKAYWANQIENGVSLRDVAEGFMASDEMRTHDLAHTQWDFIA